MTFPTTSIHLNLFHVNVDIEGEMGENKQSEWEGVSSVIYPRSHIPPGFIPMGPQPDEVDSHHSPPQLSPPTL